MGNKVIVTRSKLDLLADSISEKSGESLPLTIGEMKIAVDSIVLNTQIIGDGELDVDENDYLYFDDSGAIVPTGTISITSNGTYNVTSYASAQVSVGNTIQTQTKSVSPTESQQIVEPDSGYYLSSVTVSAISSSYVGSSIDQNDASDIIVNGATINVPPGYYALSSFVSVEDGTAGTPFATKGTVSNHQISVTPSVTNQTGWITGGEKIGTAVTVTASELASGNKSISSNGTDIDVIGYSTVSVSVSPSLQSKTNISPTTLSQTISADSGYDGLSSVQINAMPTMTLPTSASASATSGYTSKATISRSTSNQYINIPTGYNSAGAYYLISATPNGTVTAPSSISGSLATVSTGTNTLTLTKTVSVTPNVTTAGYISSGTAGDSSVSLTASVNTRSSSDLTASGDTVTVPAGYYGSQATKAVSSMTLPTSASASSSGTSKATIGRSTSNQYINVPTGYNSTASYYTISAVADGTAGTPSATKGTVSNHQVSVTPSVTNTTGYITGGTKTGTAVTVTASELASGNKAIVDNGTGIDVVGYSTVSVAVSFSTITVSSSNPTSGANGDVWIKTS